MDPKAVTEALPTSFLPAALRAIFVGRAAASDHCKAEFSTKQARNVRPFYARGKIEDLLHDSAEVEPDWKASTVTKSGWSHVELAVGKLIVTSHSVQTPCAMVDPADYRLELAVDNTPALFDLPGQPSADPDRIYAVLIHTSYRGRPNDAGNVSYGHLPGSAYLAFPVAGLTLYGYSVNLFDRYPKIVREYLPVEWTEEAEIKYFFWQARQRSA